MLCGLKTLSQCPGDMTLAALLAVATASPVSIDSSVGHHLSLSCPSSFSSCGPACTWQGPHNVSVSSEQSETSYSGLRVSFDQSQCKCLLLIQNTSLEHSGLWTCHLTAGNNKQKERHPPTTKATDLKKLPLNNSEAFRDGSDINENKEHREWEKVFFSQKILLKFTDFHSLLLSLRLNRFCSWVWPAWHVSFFFWSFHTPSPWLCVLNGNINTARERTVKIIGKYSIHESVN